MYRLPAYGWSSTKDHIGVYFINPTHRSTLAAALEKMDLVPGHDGRRPHAGLLHLGPLCRQARGMQCSRRRRVEAEGRRADFRCRSIRWIIPKEPSQAELDTLAATQGNPTVPQTWHDNSLALWNDALDKAKEVEAAWPYDWVSGVDYPHKNERGNVTGQFVLNDPQAATTNPDHSDRRPGPSGLHRYAADLSRNVPESNGNLVTWQHDGNYYEFWNQGAEDGKFKITNVRPGKYTLYAFADGVLGEYAKTDITVEAGSKIS